MTLYTIKWREVHEHEIDIDADGESEALEEFWSKYHDASGAPFWDDSQTAIDGPLDISVHFMRAIPLIPYQIQEKP